MIFAVAGSPGSFKSVYVLQKHIIPALAKGRHVYTNIEDISPVYIALYFGLDPIDCESHLHILGREYDQETGQPLAENPDLVRHFYKDVPNNALIVIDEAQNYYSSRDFKSDYSKEVIAYLTRHRHYGHDVIYITQNIDAVDITFRRNTQFTYVFKRGDNVGMSGTAFIFVYDRTDLERKYLARMRFSPDPATFKCYSSYEGEDVKETRKSYNVILRSKGFWFFICGLLGMLFMFLSGRFDYIIHPSKKFVEQNGVKRSVSSSSSAVPLGFAPNGISSSYQLQVNQPCVKEWISVHGSQKFVLSDGSIVDRTSYGSCPK